MIFVSQFLILLAKLIIFYCVISILVVCGFERAPQIMENFFTWLCVQLKQFVLCLWSVLLVVWHFEPWKKRCFSPIFIFNTLLNYLRLWLLVDIICMNGMYEININQNKDHLDDKNHMDDNNYLFYTVLIIRTNQNGYFSCQLGLICPHLLTKL